MANKPKLGPPLEDGLHKTSPYATPLRTISVGAEREEENVAPDSIKAGRDANELGWPAERYNTTLVIHTCVSHLLHENDNL